MPSNKSNLTKWNKDGRKHTHTRTSQEKKIFLFFSSLTNRIDGNKVVARNKWLRANDLSLLIFNFLHIFFFLLISFDQSSMALPVDFIFLLAPWIYNSTYIRIFFFFALSPSGFISKFATVIHPCWWHKLYKEKNDSIRSRFFFAFVSLIFV